MAKIQNDPVRKYPDIAEIIQAKEKRRKELAKLPISEKIEIMSKMKEASLLIKNSKRITLK